MPRTPDAHAAAQQRDTTPSPPTSGASRRVHFPLDVPPVTIPQEHEKSPKSPAPATPIRHSRIPSTGNRATVMDVAQALSQYEEQDRKSSADDAASPTSKTEEPQRAEESEREAKAIPRLDVKSMISNWGRDNGPPSPVSPIPADKRRSSYEKYSAFTLPPLLEEKTPVSSPTNTLGRHTILAVIPQEKEEPAKPTEQSNGSILDLPASPTSDSPESLLALTAVEPEAAKLEVDEPRVEEIITVEAVVDPYVHFGKPSLYVRAHIFLNLVQTTSTNLCQRLTLHRCSIAGLRSTKRTQMWQPFLWI